MGIAANGTVVPIGLPWILSIKRIITGTTVTYILVEHDATIINDVDLSYFYSDHTKIHVQGYRTSILFTDDITTRVFGSATVIHLQGYRANIC